VEEECMTMHVLTNGQRELRDSIKSDEPSDTRHFVPMREDASILMSIGLKEPIGLQRKSIEILGEKYIPNHVYQLSKFISSLKHWL
jgi:hypothetical protein